MRVFISRQKTFAYLLLLIFCFWGNGCGPVEDHPPGAVIIEGDGVENTVSFTLEELKALEDGLVEADYYALNSYGTEGRFHFKGIWVWHIIEKMVNLQDDAAVVNFIGQDDYQVEFTLEDVKKEDYIDEGDPAVKHKMIIAWEEDGVEYDPSRGNPFQLVVGQREPGDVNRPYWVRNLKVIRID